VRSCEWKSLWDFEIKNNPELFSSTIISIHKTRIEALSAELELQKLHNAILDPTFINRSYATVNGFFGNGASGVHHPMHGKKHSPESRQKISANHADVSGANNPMYGKPGVKGMLGKNHSEETKAKMKANQWDRSGTNNPMFGRVHPSKGCTRSIETRSKMKGPKELVKCPHCLKEGGKPVMNRFHFANCRYREEGPSL
jgi:hypothetical protein